jgi:hypothetical protein
MKRILVALSAASLAAAIANPPAYAAAKKDPATAQRKADCQKQAKDKKFGIHLLQKRDFMKKCMGEKAA